MSLVIDDVLVRHDPTNDAVPVVFDSPHSGSCYPSDFHYVCALAQLRRTEDAYVDQLFSHVPELGATLLCALFPRVFIDVNRALDDFSADLLNSPWPSPLNPSEKSDWGLGLIRSHLCPVTPIYTARLSVTTVMDRIDRYWRPYHEALAGALDHLHACWGAVWHVNCHSMPSLTNADGSGYPMTDIVLGNRNGSTCSPEFTDLVAETLRAFGYRVRVNEPYAGVELVKRYSAPGRRRHSLQIEIDRRLYMNEETLELHEGFEPLRRDLTRLAERICHYARREVRLRAAE